MNKSLDFNKFNKNDFTVTLRDGKKLLITTASKKMVDKLMMVGEKIDTLDKNSDETDKQQLDDLYDITAKLMNKNKNNIEITKEYVEENFDLEDIIVFFRGYIDFLSEIANQKN